MVAQQYAPGFALPLALKDVNLALAEAEASGVPMPVARTSTQKVISATAKTDGLLTGIDGSTLRIGMAAAGSRPGSLGTEGLDAA